MRKRLVVGVALLLALLGVGGAWALSGPLAASPLFMTTAQDAGVPSSLHESSAAHDALQDNKDASPTSSSVDELSDNSQAHVTDAHESSQGLAGADEKAEARSADGTPEATDAGYEGLSMSPHTTQENPSADYLAPSASEVGEDVYSAVPDAPAATGTAQAAQTAPQTSPTVQPTQPTQASGSSQSYTPAQTNTAVQPSTSQQDEASLPAQLSISVLIDGTAAGFPASSTCVTLEQGASVYDALLASTAQVNARQTLYGIYVAAINGLAERDFGAQSGWMYAVNGSYPNTPCSNYVLADGDELVWIYVNAEV